MVNKNQCNQNKNSRTLMKDKILYLFACLMIFGLFSACEQNKKEQQQAIQARQDSLERVRQRKRQQRLDSLAAARADSIAAASAANEKGKPVFNPQDGMSQSGHYAVQVGAWRSKDKAQRLAEMWRPRGFENAYVVKHGNPETGNIWFRVRLGKFFTEQQTQNLQTWLTENYQTDSWITYVE